MGIFIWAKAFLTEECSSLYWQIGAPRTEMRNENKAISSTTDLVQKWKKGLRINEMREIFLTKILDDAIDVMHSYRTGHSVPQ